MAQVPIPNVELSGKKVSGAFFLGYACPLTYAKRRKYKKYRNCMARFAQYALAYLLTQMHVRRKVEERRHWLGLIPLEVIQEAQGLHPLVKVVCISYLVLYNKSCQNIAACNNYHWLSPAVFVGQKFREGISRMAFFCCSVSGVPTRKLKGWGLGLSKGALTHIPGAVSQKTYICFLQLVNSKHGVLRAR